VRGFAATLPGDQDERESFVHIFTLDRTHFSIYRPGRRRRFSIVPG
jgi:hypothetical protein